MGKLVRDETLEMINSTLNEINKTIGGRSSGGVVYGFHINSSIANPSDRVTYLRDAVGMIPAKMDYASDTFDYGTWGGAFFMPKPCMLTYGGKVDYYLNPNDYTKKEDGTPSDVANTDYDGNAMMEFQKIWIKIVADKNNPVSGEVYIADHKADEGFKDWCYINAEGNHVSKMYKPIYAGSEVSGKLRSLSGLHPTEGKNTTQQRGMAQACGFGWDIESYSETVLMWALLILMGKSTDVQTVFGCGNDNGYNTAKPHNGMLASGAGDSLGLFHGYNHHSSAVKVFGIENFWANQYRRELGLINDHGIYKVKMAYGTEDGSEVIDYNETGSGYVEVGSVPAQNGYVKDVSFEHGIMLPSNTSGGSSTYYCDYFYRNDQTIYLALRGGNCSNGLDCGFFFHLSSDAANASWHIGASPSFKPLS